jgi:ankyrin repeat protein
LEILYESEGLTPLLFASKYGSSSAVSSLLSKNVNLLATDNENNNILHLASKNTDSLILITLLSLIDENTLLTLLDQLNDKNQTPLLITLNTDTKTLQSQINQSSENFYFLPTPNLINFSALYIRMNELDYLIPQELLPIEYNPNISVSSAILAIHSKVKEN